MLGGLKDPHLTIEDIFRISRQRFESDEAKRVARHLSRNCSTCWQAVHELCSRGTGKVSGVEDPLIASTLVRAALGCIVDAEVGKTPEHLRPAHAQALKLVAGAEPLAFGRLVLEEALEMALGAPGRAVALLNTSLKIHSATGLSREFHREDQDLEALHHVYLAEIHRISARHDAAASELRLAESLLDETESSPEIWAAFYERKSDLARSLRRLPEAWRMAKEAEKWSEDDASPAVQLAEVQLRLGTILTALGRPAEAAGLLGNTLALVKSYGYRRLELELTHQLAVALCGDRQFEQVVSTLMEANDLYEKWASKLLQAQRWRLLGLGHLQENPWAAVVPLWEAAKALSSLGHEWEALQALLDLDFLYQCRPELEAQNSPSDDQPTKDRLSEKIASIGKAPEVVEEYCQRLSGLLRIAEARGIDACHLSELHSRLGAARSRAKSLSTHTTADPVVN